MQKQTFEEAMAQMRECCRPDSVSLAMAEEIEQLRQEVAALKAWRDSATGCEARTALPEWRQVCTLSVEDARWVIAYDGDEVGQQAAEQAKSAFHGLAVDGSLFERNPDGSVKRVDGKPVPRQPDDPSEGDRLMAFFKGE